MEETNVKLAFLTSTNAHNQHTLWRRLTSAHSEENKKQLMQLISYVIYIENSTDGYIQDLL